MENRPSKRVFRKHASVILMTHFGSLDVRVIVCIVLLLISLDLFCAAIGDILTGLAGEGLQRVAWALRLGAFPALLAGFWLRARRTSRRVHTHIEERTHPRPVEVLVLFLSVRKKGQDDRLIEQIVAKGGDIEDLSLREQFKGPWRMPLEAIAYHHKRLKQIVVIVSKESAEQVGQFKSLVQSLTHTRTSETLGSVRVSSPSDLDGLHDFLDPEEVRKRNGVYPLDSVDFENAAEQNTVLNGVLDWLMTKEGVPIDQIMIDVTGGRKPSSIVGTIVALGKDWSVEYVSVTEDEDADGAETAAHGLKKTVRIKEYVFTVKASDVRY
jgi:hypothetical protein